MAADTLWYENTKTGVQWHVVVGSDAQLSLASDSNYVVLPSDPTLPAPAIPESVPASPTPAGSDPKATPKTVVIHR